MTDRTIGAILPINSDFRGRTILARLTALMAVAFASAACVFAAPPQSTTSLQSVTRIVFVGDSITGQGANNANGWVHLIDWALHQDAQGPHPVLVPLGGSGQGVGSWTNVEKTSRTKTTILDVPGYDVKANLDQPADVVVVMLGMNDILAPYVSDKPASIDEWEKNYQTLIDAIRARTHPKIFAIATITPCGERLDSPRNRLRALLNERIPRIAAAENCIVLPTGAEDEALLAAGRTHAPAFHITRDFVHPDLAGHVAIAAGMLKGLGDPQAAAALYAKYLPQIWTDAAPKLPALSWAVTPAVGAVGTYQIRYWWTGPEGKSTSVPKVSVTVPDGWKTSESSVHAKTGTLTISGSPDRLQSIVLLNASSPEGDCAASIPIPAPWLVAAGIPNEQAWPAQKFNPSAGALPWDAAVAKGDINQAGLNWVPYYASNDFTGGDDPGSINFTAVGFGSVFEAGYAVRWIHSDRDRPVTLQLGSHTFAGIIGLSVWVNGASKYASIITSERGKHAVVDAQLNAGWNSLVVKCNHLTWQWQVSVDLAGQTGDDLSDLRYSITNPSRATK